MRIDHGVSKDSLNSVSARSPLSVMTENGAALVSAGLALELGAAGQLDREHVRLDRELGDKSS